MDDRMIYGNALFWGGVWPLATTAIVAFAAVFMIVCWRRKLLAAIIMGMALIATVYAWVDLGLIKYGLLSEVNADMVKEPYALFACGVIAQLYLILRIGLEKRARANYSNGELLYMINRYFWIEAVAMTLATFGAHLGLAMTKLRNPLPDRDWWQSAVHLSWTFSNTAIALVLMSSVFATWHALFTRQGYIRSHWKQIDWRTLSIRQPQH